MSYVLGNKQIKKRIGKDIFIYPFKESNLKGTSYNLTASKVAYLASNYMLAINGKDEIVVPPGETVLIQTEEAIYTRRNICGTYHSKVSLVTEGFSHIGTTLDPEYFGASLIALTNHTKLVKKIRCGESIVTVMFYKVRGCDKTMKDNSQNRDDLMPKEFNGFKQNLTQKQRYHLEKEVNKSRNVEWKKDYTSLINIVRKENNIKKFSIQDLIFLLIFSFVIVIVYKLYNNNLLSLEAFISAEVGVLMGMLTWLTDVSKKFRKD
ncbi:hypothetical protein H8S20_12960 [Clostridium sp. NSJ-6]|uniref:dUTPase-like domain-containing protein n=1 Tax=Clostridium hominis TaxID=2763036 RepID=A0ABR7DEB6_9CLOT|nr:hypothetical protein [Clostridium hominis]MBC5629792.1 hypothetical protein [Clostridium hominis]